jgi:hypothetical protein
LIRIKQKSSAEQVFAWVVVAGIAVTISGIALYGYLGTFSRYGSDDYCLSAFFVRDGDLISKMISRYQLSSSRYTNILFIGLVDRVFGWYNVAILPGLMLALLVLGLFWFLHEISRSIASGWDRKLSLYSAGLIVYFSILQAPNLYETLYWRAGMTSHFVPLVCLPFLGVFLIRQIRNLGETSHPIWFQIVGFISAFVLGGFSEPPTTLLITILVLAILGVWGWGDLRTRRPIITLLSWTLAGALLALITLALAPANNLRLGNSHPRFYGLVTRTFRYPFLFIIDEFQKFPLPAMVTMVLSGLLFFVEYLLPSKALSREVRIRLVILLPVVVLIGYLLIAATFAPSVYGQNFPVARARFAGRVLLSCILMINGAVLGMLLTTLQMKLIKSASLHFVAIFMLFLLSLYPLRMASRLSAEIPVYKQRAAEWDQRDAQIRAMKADGIRDLILLRLPLEVIQDFQDRTRFRLNRCASILYGVDTILAFPPEGE